jgi:hypothetical protein
MCLLFTLSVAYNHTSRNLTVKYSRLVQGAVIKIISLTLQFYGRNRRIRLQWHDKITKCTNTYQSGLFNLYT